MYSQLSTQQAQDVEWQERMRMGQMSFNQGNYRESKRQYEKAVRSAETFSHHDSRLSMALLNLAMACYASGRDDLADPYFKEALKIDESILAPNSRELAIDLIDIAAHDHRLARDADAETLYKRALEILENCNEPTRDGDIALALNNLGLLYCDQGAPSKAEATLKRALEIREAAFARNSKEVAESLVNLATLFASTNRIDDAIAYYERAISILEVQLGPNHPELAGVLEDYGSLLSEIGSEVEARPLLQRAREIAGKNGNI